MSPERHYLGGAKSAFSESINHIRLGLTYSDVDNPPQIIMVTSAIPGEGKTTLCTNLALSYSRMGRTLLLDADLRKPRIAEISGLKHFGGLTDLVAGTLELDEAIVIDRDSENLFVLRSGTNPPNPMELLSLNKFERLLTEVRKDFDYVLVDSPPVLPVSDALLLGQLVDSVVLVVRAEKTNRSATKSALKNLLRTS